MFFKRRTACCNKSNFQVCQQIAYWGPGYCLKGRLHFFRTTLQGKSALRKCCSCASNRRLVEPPLSLSCKNIYVFKRVANYLFLIWAKVWRAHTRALSYYHTCALLYYQDLPGMAKQTTHLYKLYRTG